eukprot:2510255-Alexandrium_andersonii.AAC.2
MQSRNYPGDWPAAVTAARRPRSYRWGGVAGKAWRASARAWRALFASRLPLSGRRCAPPILARVVRSRQPVFAL